MAERTSSSRRTKPTSDDAIGNFVIDKEIGKGSFAQVYSGRHKVSAIPGLQLSGSGHGYRPCTCVGGYPSARAEGSSGGPYHAFCLVAVPPQLQDLLTSRYRSPAPWLPSSLSSLPD
jgi:hypothetical protein